MGKSENLLNLICNFVGKYSISLLCCLPFSFASITSHPTIITCMYVGVAIVLQIDEFLASYIRIKDIDPELLEKKSWRTKMMLRSKIWLILIAALLVYCVTVACWRLDSLYCGSYNYEDNVNFNNVDPSS
jgi:hypothetical protein